MGRRPVVSAVVVVALLLLVGCGTDRAPTPSADPVATAAQPVVEGNRLVDRATGDDFVPRGVNWTSFEFACAQGWGYSELDHLDADDPLADTVAGLVDWGVNTVRLPLNQDCWLGTRGAPVSDEWTERTPQEYRASVDRLVTALNEAGIVAVLDLQSRKRIGQAEFGNLAMPDADSLQFWSQVATAYADRPSVMFDAFNEPYSRHHSSDHHVVFELTWECWRDGGCHPPTVDDRTRVGDDFASYRAVGMAEVVATIRDAGAGQPIVLSGLDYANDLSGWTAYRPDDDQVVAGLHSYDTKPCLPDACFDEFLAPLAEEVPLLFTELGSFDASSSHVPQALVWADQHDVGVLFWVWQADDEDPMRLTTDGLGDSADPYGATARSWLLGHAGR